MKESVLMMDLLFMSVGHSPLDEEVWKKLEDVCVIERFFALCSLQPKFDYIVLIIDESKDLEAMKIFSALYIPSRLRQDFVFEPP